MTAPALTIGSMCSGVGGLDRAVERIFNAEPAWFCEYDDAPARILSARWPNVRNFRDITVINWRDMMRVSILCAGYPCQPFSAAGKRKGTADERHLWPYCLAALKSLRPRWAFFENVAGHLTLGFDTVMGDLARSEPRWYVRWFVCRASDIGATHHRKRVFIAVSREPWPVPAGARPIARIDDTGQWVEPDDGLFGGIPFEGRWPNAGAVVNGVAYEVDADLAAPARLDTLQTPTAALAGGVQVLEEQVGGRRRFKDEISTAELLPTPTTQPMTGNGHARHLGGARSDEMLLPGVAVAAARGDLADGALLPTPAASNPNDGEDPATWEARRAELAKRHGNNGAGMPLGIAVQTLPTPRASRGASDTETMYALGGVRDDSSRRQGEVVLPTPTASDHKGMTRPVGRVRRDGRARGEGDQRLADAVAVLPTPRAAEARQSMTAPAARQHVADGNGGLSEVLGAHMFPTPSAADGNGGGRFNKPGHSTLPGTVRELPQPQGIDWGKYAPAITRWEHVLGRPAPAPTEPNSNGKPRLAARFAEWMMGWPEGWVTGETETAWRARLAHRHAGNDARPVGHRGTIRRWISPLTRAEQLKAIGNGVVDLQAEHAIRMMMSWPAESLAVAA